MAKRTTPLKDEPLDQVEEICTKFTTLEQAINTLSEYMKKVAEHGGYDSEFNFICNEFNVRKTMEEALGEYLRNNKLKFEKTSTNDDELTKAKQLLEEYGTALKKAVDAADKGNSGEAPPTTVVIHEAAPSYVEQPQELQLPEHPGLPTTVKGLFAYLLLRMPWYYVQKFFSSRHVRWTCRAILFSVWLISLCLTCIIAYDNARLHTVEKKYVLLREFARQDKEWADKADLIEYLYTDEAEHQEAIQTLWENRRKRLERR